MTMHLLSRRNVTKMLVAAPGMALVATGRASFGVPWSGWAQVPGGGATIGAPAAFKLDGGGGVLYVVVRGTDSRIYYNRLVTSDALTAWSGWRAIPGGGQTTSGPTVPRTRTTRETT